MKSNQPSQFLPLILAAAILSSILACAGEQKKEPQAEVKAPVETVSEPGFVENQPIAPVAEDDPFFRAPIREGEVYRVLVTKENYSVRQMSARETMERPADSKGDREQLNAYREIHDQIDFKDWEIEGTLDVRLNPHTGQIEQLRYVPGRTPRTWQAARLFQEDMTRYRFKFLRGAVSPIKFTVDFRWVIKRRAGLTDQEARARVIQYLKSQKQ